MNYSEYFAGKEEDRDKQRQADFSPFPLELANNNSANIDPTQALSPNMEGERVLDYEDRHGKIVQPGSLAAVVMADDASAPNSQQFAGSIAATQASSRGAVDRSEAQFEKHWVQIVINALRETRNNPYEKQRRINMLQADYIKKRYNKSVKAAK